MPTTMQQNEPSSDQLQPVVHTPQLGDLLVSYLEQIGVEYVFGIPGGAIEPLYNAMARSARRGGLRPIVARHETGAAFMADGYTRETGKLGVCCATTGPGATNLITGVASAYADNIPMLVITAQTALYTFGKGAAQDSSCTGINTLGMFEHCTRYNSFVSHVEQFEGKLIAAIMTAFESPRGPVHLSIPIDILRSHMPMRDNLFPLDRLLRQSSLFGEEIVEELYENIQGAKNIVFLVGSGCGEAIGKILGLAQLTDATVLTTPRGKGLVSSYHPQFKGVFGFAGHHSAYRLLTDASVDLVLAIGTDLGELDSSGWDEHAILNDKLIHIDSVIEHLTRSPMARLHVYGNLLSLFNVLLKCYGRGRQTNAGESDAEHQQDERRLRGSDNRIPGGAEDERTSALSLPLHLNIEEREKYSDNSTPIKPQRLMRELSTRFPLNTRFFADSGNSFAWSIHYLNLLDRRVAGTRPVPGGLFRLALGSGAMTWAIGAAVGTALASPGTPVVCITGDGSFLMGGQEITVAVAERLPVIFVVLNDSALGMVKHGQRLAGAEAVGYELPRVDFCALAKALGADAHTIHSPQDMERLNIDAMCKRHGPTLLDVYIDPDEVPPMGERIKTLNAGQ